MNKSQQMAYVKLQFMGYERDSCILDDIPQNSGIRKLRMVDTYSEKK